jgi:predicted lipoprotein with Yx(FWY)xxD motif
VPTGKHAIATRDAHAGEEIAMKRILIAVALAAIGAAHAGKEAPTLRAARAKDGTLAVLSTAPCQVAGLPSESQSRPAS